MAKAKKTTTKEMHRVDYIQREIKAKDHWLLTKESKLFDKLEEARKLVKKISSGSLDKKGFVLHSPSIHQVHI